MLTLLTYLRANKCHALYEIESSQWWTMLALDITFVCIVLIAISLVWIAFGWKIT